MAVDFYSPCPCGSGKKLKFCCSDLAVDIEKIHKMVAGEQPHAALNHVEQLLHQQPNRASLLDLRASIELSMHEFEAARKTIGAYLAAHAGSPTAHAHHAIYNAATGNSSLAVASLQSALEQLGDEMPRRVLEAVGAVGQVLLIEGQLVGARGHLMLSATIARGEDNQAMELLLRMNLRSELPLLVREYLFLAECPGDVLGRAKFEEAAQLASRGLWRRAETVFASLRSEVGAVPEVVYNLALMRGWLGDTERFAAGLHEYAALDIPKSRAAEAEALAQLVDPSLEDPQQETVKLVYALGDIDLLGDCFQSDQRVEDYPLPPPEGDAEETIRPRSTHVLLDRPAPATGIGIARADIPHVIAFLSVYGKRTDRDAQLEVTTDRGSPLDTVMEMLSEIAGDAIAGSATEEVVAKKSVSEESLSWRWRLPNDTTAQQRQIFLAEERREAILRRWTTAPRAALGNKSPQDAVGDVELSVALLASVLIIEQAAADPSEMSLFAELRQQLKLPPAERIDPEGVDLERLPLVRIPHLELAKVPEDRLTKLLDRTLIMGANFATLLVARELAERTDLAEGTDLAPAYRQLVRLEPNYQVAQAWVSKARSWSERHSQSVAEWALLELELAIKRGNGDEAKRLLGEIRGAHLNEPGVAEATYRMLYSAGLIAADQTAPTELPEHARATAGAEPSAIWTPDAKVPSPKRDIDGTSHSAIWTP